MRKVFRAKSIWTRRYTKQRLAIISELPLTLFRDIDVLGSSNFLRSARPAEAAIAKVFAQVFAKIRQKILFCKFFGRAGRTGTSRTTRRQNFSLERPLAVPKTSKKRKKKSELFTTSELSFSSFSIDFGGARVFLTSKSRSSRFFALDGHIFRFVRRLGLIFRFFMCQHEAPRACKRRTTVRDKATGKGRVGVNPYPFMG